MPPCPKNFAQTSNSGSTNMATTISAIPCPVRFFSNTAPTPN
jgi:hypothetical protein